jgi:hypothetical protein
MHLTTSEDIEIQREVIACLCNLSLSDENKFEIIKAGACTVMISLSQSADMIVASQGT